MGASNLGIKYFASSPVENYQYTGKLMSVEAISFYTSILFIGAKSKQEGYDCYVHLA